MRTKGGEGVIVLVRETIREDCPARSRGRLIGKRIRGIPWPLFYYT